MPSSIQEFATRQGSNGAMPAVHSPSDRDKAFMPETAPLRLAPSQAPFESSINKGVQLGSPAVAPLQPSQTIQTPAASNPAFSPGVNSPARPLPPPTVPTTSVSAPLAVPVPSASPQSSSGGILQVESYDESTYTCKANDTFPTISREWYHTDQYERALLLFNRNHPLASDALRQGSPALQAGQPLYIPPARILEKYYGAPALDTAPVAPLAPPPARPGQDAAGPVPQMNSNLAAPGITVKPLPPPGSVPLYRVHDGGEMIGDIARHLLGDSDRWTEIYRLNPRVIPKEPIAGGSQLRLPRDAHIDPQDIP
jgi:nucleoid-associated protein YgaU